MKQSRKHIASTDVYSLEVDIEKNRVYFCIRGHWDKNTPLENYLDEWEKTISCLQPNFTIISDIHTMLPHALVVEKVHEQVQKFLIEKGLYKVAEVASINDIADLQASRVAQRSKLPVNKFSTFEEAEKYLDRLVEDLE